MPIVNHRKCAVFAALLFLLLPYSVTAKDFSRLYSKQELIHVQKHYGPHIKGILFSDIYQYLTPEEKRSLAMISLDVPLYGSRRGLFEYSMDLNSGKMTTSALSVKFFDDLSIAFAWYDRHRLDMGRIMAYITKLYKSPDYFENPLKALGVPDNALNDSFVDDVSQKTLKSAIAYILIHEFGHWYFHHKSYDVVSPLRAQRQEMQSDILALDIMERMQTSPDGMAVWFMVTSLFDNDKTGTHPVSSTRLYAIADRLDQHPAAFISYENRESMNIESVRSLARNIRTIGREIEKNKSALH